MTKPITIEFTPKDLVQRMARFPRRFKKEMEVAFDASLAELHDSLPSYPPPPKNSSYRRTGTLGRSFTAGNLGNIRYKRTLGGVPYEGALGSHLVYAEFVVGEKQAKQHQGRWWTPKRWKSLAEPKVRRIFESLAETLAQFLEGKG